MPAANGLAETEHCSFDRGDEEQPIRLLQPPPPFPVDSIPEPSQSLITEGAAAIGVPLDLIAASYLGFAAGATRREQGGAA